MSSRQLRDELVVLLQDRLPEVDVRAVFLPFMNPEDLDGNPVLAVRVAAREIAVDMGPDSKEVTISLGLFDMFDQPEEFQFDRDKRLAYEVEQNDRLDEIIEKVIAFWTPNGELSREIIADHRFTEIEQTQMIDAPQYVEFAIWTAPVMLTYFDMKDE